MTDEHVKIPITDPSVFANAMQKIYAAAEVVGAYDFDAWLADFARSETTVFFLDPTLAQQANLNREKIAAIAETMRAARDFAAAVNRHRPAVALKTRDWPPL